MAEKQMIDINFFRPVNEKVRNEAKAAKVIIVLWFCATFLTPIIIALTGGPDGSQSFLCKIRFLGFPFHYWLVAQGSTIGYVVLCWLFEKLWNKFVKGE